MVQYFDSIKVSDKGMIKLVRDNGKDYIFPASNVITVSGEEKKEIEGVNIVLKLVLSCLVSSQAGVENENHLLTLKTKNDTFRIKTNPTDELKTKINNAIDFSNRVFKKKYGTFS